MLNKVDVYSTSPGATELTFDVDGFAETDLVQVTNIDGLDPVKAAIDVVSSGNVDGAVSMDSQVPTRNIIMTVRPNPNWTTWTPETLRQKIYSFFIPKTIVKLVFDSDEIDMPVEISGTVESCDANPFTKDPSYVVSIICPDPYFVSSDPIIVTGSVISPDDYATSKSTIDVDGNIPIGIQVKLADGFNAEIYIQAGNPANSTFHVIAIVTEIFQIDSRPLLKFIRKIDPDNGMFVNLLPNLQLGSKWPVLNPGANDFAIMGPSAGFPWELTYYNKYGGI